MTLVETYKAVVPSVIAFISKFGRTRADATPLAPAILGTGFLVHEDGIVVTNRHVADVFATIPAHPKTGAAGYGAILFECGQTDERGPYIRWMIAEVFGYTTLGQFSSQEPWHGEALPDIAFVQLKMRATPFLKLASHDFYVEPGTPIATMGFPLGADGLTVMKKLNQMIPFIRRGIVSSVFPFAIPHPHGFTIDILQQGGSSGSPIFYEHEPTAVGMMDSSIVEPVTLGDGAQAVCLKLATNISIAVAAHLIESALQSFRTTYPVDRSAFPTLKELQDDKDAASDLAWEILGPA